MLEDYVPPKQGNISEADSAERREVLFNLTQIAQMKRSLREHGGYWMVMPGMTHFDFTDAPFYSVSRGRLVIKERLARIVSRYTIAFFDKHLKGVDQPLLQGPSMEIPEVHFEAWKARTEGKL